MVIKKIQYGYLPEPNVTKLKPEMRDDNLIVIFPLNYHINNKIKETDRGELTFHNCKAWRYGAPNDESFYGLHEGTNYQQLGFEMDNLYEVEGFETDFIKQQSKLLVNPLNKHYLFFTKEGTLECLANNIRFKRLDEN